MAGVRAAFDTVVSSLSPGDVDAAVVALGETLADAIDSADDLQGEARTKALYLTPHLMNVLKEMLATPASRATVKGAAGPTMSPGVRRLKVAPSGKPA